MERKRELDGAHGGGAKATPSKRMHLASEEEESPAYAELEVRCDLTQAFRKEAIFRRLREAQREVRRLQDESASSSELLASAQRHLAAVDAFWAQVRGGLTQLLEHMREAPLADAAPGGSSWVEALRRITPRLYLEDGTSSSLQVLQERQDALTQLLAWLATRAPATAEASSVQERCMALTGEVSALQSTLADTERQLCEARARVDDALSKWRAAERRADRATSASVRRVEDPSSARAAEEKRDATPATPATPGTPATPAPASADDKAAPDDGAAAAAATAAAAAASAAAADELASLRDVAQARELALVALRSELVAAKQAAATLETQLQALPEERIVAHAAYHALQAKLSFLQQEAERAWQDRALVEQENAELREFRVEFQRQTTTQAHTHSEELQKQLKARDADIVRLRGQRDELNAELLERRARETVKFQQADEVKALLAAREERIAALQLETQRLQQEAASRAAADEGGAGDAAEPLLKKLNAANASSAALCDEIDRLSAAYDQLDKQASQRVSQVERLEEKILRLTTEKAKADNKYFAAMRAKDALEAEMRALARSAERQAKVMERFQDTEKGLQLQLTQAEKEMSALRQQSHTHATRLAELERDVAVGRRRVADAERARAAAEQSMAQHVAASEQASAARLKAEERCQALERDKERLRRRVAEQGSVRRRDSEADTPLDYLNSLLRCSACKERYRERVITRCFHTFCEPCVQARLQTRQRKCPHCGVAFSSSDVQVLYCT